MAVHHHTRFKVFSQHHHPFKHVLSDFVFSHEALPSGVSNMEDAMKWVFDVLYPKAKPAVADVASLPLAGNSIGDYRVVNDDGDGKYASYQWAQYDGEATPSWHKIMDLDWGMGEIVAELEWRTQPWYVMKKGNDDADSTGTVIVGTLAGQTIYGGASANTNLTLFANNGDPVGNSGYVQFGDNVRPIADSTFSLGTTAERFLKVWTDEITVDTMTILGGSITDSSGSISFDDENLSTTGTLASGTHTISSDLVLATGSITSASGAISFGDENLTTTGNISGATVYGTTGGVFGSDITISTGQIVSASGTITFVDENLTTTGDGTFGRLLVDTFTIDADTISTSGAMTLSTALNGDITLSPNGTGVISALKQINGTSAVFTGNVDAESITVNNLTLDGSTISSSTDLTLNPTGDVITSNVVPNADDTRTLGSVANAWSDFFLKGDIRSGIDTLTNATLMSFRDANVGVGVGYTLFWDGSKWVASAPDSEIDHGTITGLGDDDHTQYALLAGRAGGQTLNGGTVANSLLLRAFSGSDGINVESTALLPSVDGTYDLGSLSNQFDDLYMTGEGFGFRAENRPDPTALAGSVGTIGRVYMGTNAGKKTLFVDIGTAVKRVGQNTFYDNLIDASVINGATGVDVSASVTDARKAIWQLRRSSTNENLGLSFTVSATHVIFDPEIDVDAGNYTLIGIEVE